MHQKELDSCEQKVWLNWKELLEAALQPCMSKILRHSVTPVVVSRLNACILVLQIDSTSIVSSAYLLSRYLRYKNSRRVTRTVSECIDLLYRGPKAEYRYAMKALLAARKTAVSSLQRTLLNEALQSSRCSPCRLCSLQSTAPTLLGRSMRSVGSVFRLFQASDRNAPFWWRAWQQRSWTIRRQHNSSEWFQRRCASVKVSSQLFNCIDLESTRSAAISRPAASSVYQPFFRAVSVRRRYTPRIPEETALYGLMGANVAVFLAWRGDARFMLRHFTTSWDAVREGRLHTLVLSAFSQRDTWHLISNMIGLYFFGRLVVILQYSLLAT